MARKTKRTRTNPKETLPDLPEEMWARILELFVRDRHGNVVVPALAQLTRLSRTSKQLMRLARATETPYDAEIQWDTGPEMGMPVKFSGGVAFGEFRFCFALVIIREVSNGRMFVVSTAGHKGFDEHGEQFHGNDEEDYVQVVKRHYSLCRLAQLLGGHTAEWEKRLSDFSYMQYHIERWGPLAGRRLTQNANDFVLAKHRDAWFIPPTGFTEPSNQLLSTSLMPYTNRVHQHHNDFITYCVREGSKVDQLHNGSVVRRNVFQREHQLVLFEAEDNGSHNLCDPEKIAKYVNYDECWYGKAMRNSKVAQRVVAGLEVDHYQYAQVADAPNSNWFFFVRPGIDPLERASDLSIALGLYSDPVQATGCNWLRSLFNHYDGKYELLVEEAKLGTRGSERRAQKMKEWGPFPTSHKWNTTDDMLMRMGELAIAADDYLSSQAEAPRVQRGAAAKALKSMHRCFDEETAPIKDGDDKGDPDYARGMPALDDDDASDDDASDDDDDASGNDASDASEVHTITRIRRAAKRKPKRAPKRAPKRTSALDSTCSVTQFLFLVDRIGR